MKKILFPILLSLLLFQNAYCINDPKPLKDVGIAKYAVLEVNSNNSPLREKDNEDAKRVSHLYQNTIVFASKENKDYYRVELEDENFWINKKYVDVQAIIPEKRFEEIENINFKENKKEYILNINAQTLGAYVLKEKDKTLDCVFYDMHFDPNSFKNPEKLDLNFKLTNKIDTKLQVDYKNNSPFFGYGVFKDDNGYKLLIKKAPQINPKKPLKKIKITLDAGHGGSELGATCFDLKEKDINLQIVKILRKTLKKRGAKVYLTRKKDKKVDLYDRISFAQNKKSDILISIHQNSLANRADITKKYGVGSYYYHPQAYNLALKIKDNLVKDTGFRDDNVNYASFAITRASLPVSVLIECGYIIRKEEAEKLNDKKFQKIIAKAITKGCEQYLKENFSKKE